MPLRIKFKINFTQTKNWRQTTSTDWGCLVFVVQSNLSSNKLIYVGCWYRPNARNHMAILGTLHEISLSITIVHMFSARNTPWLVCYLTWDITTEKYGLKQLKFLRMWFSQPWMQRANQQNKWLILCPWAEGSAFLSEVFKTFYFSCKRLLSF